VILVRDAAYSCSDACHNAPMQIDHQRCGEQIEISEAAAILARWR
jgi:hypothetical protein